MIHLAVVVDDIGVDQFMYTLYYMDKKHHFTFDIPLDEMAVMERQKAYGAMLAYVFEDEQVRKLHERPGETPEAQLLDDILEAEEGDDEEEEDE